MLANLIPARWIAAGIIALAVVSLIAGGYAYVARLQKRVVQLEIALAQEQTVRKTAEDTIAQLKRSIALGQDQVRQLEVENRKAQESWVSTLKLIDDLADCSPSSSSDPAQPNMTSANDTADRLNRANSDVNRMLERIGQ